MPIDALEKHNIQPETIGIAVEKLNEISRTITLPTIDRKRRVKANARRVHDERIIFEFLVFGCVRDDENFVLKSRRAPLPLGFPRVNFETVAALNENNGFVSFFVARVK